MYYEKSICRYDDTLCDFTGPFKRGEVSLKYPQSKVGFFLGQSNMDQIDTQFGIVSGSENIYTMGGNFNNFRTGSNNLMLGINNISIRSGSNKSISWKCIKGHSWETKLNTRVQGNFGCPFCSGRYTTLERSIGYLKPKFMDEWDEVKNEKFDPYTISSGSDIKVWWKCENDINHYWKTSKRRK